MSKTMKVNFANFLGRFPEVEPPVTLRDDSNHDFEANDPLQAEMIEQYITRYEAVEMDEFTEYIACFRLPKTADYQTVVYWKAALLSYDFIVATYGKEGNMIDKKAIAGLKVVGQDITRTIATINEDLAINIAEGMEVSGGDFNADATKARRFQILESGLIEQEY
jgi:hypothetical protein